MNNFGLKILSIKNSREVNWSGLRSSYEEYGVCLVFVVVAAMTMN